MAEGSAKFVIIARGGAFQPTTVKRLETNYPVHFQIADNAWIIKTSEASQDISTTIFPDPKHREGHVVLRFNAWWGYHSRKLWEWLQD